MLLRITMFAALGGFLFGWDLGLIGPALQTFQREEGELTTTEEGAIVGSAKLGAVAGTFIGGASMLYYGRQPTIGCSGAFFIAGPALMAAFAEVATLIVGRLLIGFGIGISAVAIPAFLGEISPAKYRGRIVEMYELLLCVGMVGSQLFDWAMSDVPGNWRWMFGAPIVPGILLMLGLLWLPESPRWLVVQGRLDEALAVMHRVYTNEHLPIGVQQSTAEVEHELLLLWSGVQQEEAAARERRRQGRQAAAPTASVASSGQANGNGVHAEDSPPSRTRGGGLFANMLTGRRHFVRMEENGTARAVSTPSAAVVTGSTAVGADGMTEVELSPVPLQEDKGSESYAGDAADEQSLAAVSDVPSSDAAAVIPVTDRPSMEPSELGEQGRGADHGNGEQAGPPDQSQLSPRLATMPSSGDGSGERESASLASSRQHIGVLGFVRTFGIMLWDIVLVARGPERRAFFIALVLAVFNQAVASTAIINYAPIVLEDMGVTNENVQTVLTISVTVSKFAGLIIALLLIDVLGRRPLLITGSLLGSLCMVVVAIAGWVGSTALLVVGMDLFLLSFSMSWAGIFWVLISEIFSMNVKSPASSMATATLFMAGAAVDWWFLPLKNALGPGSFLFYAGISFLSGIFVFLFVPETKGKTLAEVQRVLGTSVQELRSTFSVPIEPIQTPFGPFNLGGPFRGPTNSTGPLSEQETTAASPGSAVGDDGVSGGGGGFAGAWRGAGAAVRRLQVQVPRVLLRRRFDRMVEAGTPQAAAEATVTPSV